MKKISIIGCLAAAWLVVGVSGARGAAIEFDSLSLEQGFNYQKDVQKPIGFITSLKIAGMTVPVLPADLSLKDAAGPVKAVGVLESVTWAGGQGDAIQLKAAVSTKNKQTLEAALHQSMSNTAVEVQFALYNYDPIKKQWYTAFQSGANGTNAVVKGLIQKENKDLKLTIGKEPQAAVKSPQNWEMVLAIMPQSLAQPTTFCTGSGACVAKQWGVAVAK
jgi:hypothetical protein